VVVRYELTNDYDGIWPGNGFVLIYFIFTLAALIYININNI
jgi:hypothetical protein